MKNHIRKFLLITLSNVEKRDIKKQDVCLRMKQLFECVAIVVAVEEQNSIEGGKHFHAAVLNKNASKNTAMKKIRAVFSEFEGRQCNVQFHKGWGYLCAYITKQEDKNPLVWGMFSREQIMEIASQAQSKKKLLQTPSYTPLDQNLAYYASQYEGELVLRVIVRAYASMCGKQMESQSSLSEERLSSLLQSSFSEIEAFSTKEKRKKSPTYMTLTTLEQLRCSKKKQKPFFLVVDLETLLYDNINRTYAAGLMKVSQNLDLDPDSIETYSSEDYCHMPSFEERSTKFLYDFLCRIEKIASKEKDILTIYFHNLSGFEGILLLRHIVFHHKSYEFKPLMRNHRLYELVVNVKSSKKKKTFFHFIDSLNGLPEKLATLAQKKISGTKVSNREGSKLELKRTELKQLPGRGESSTIGEQNNSEKKDPRLG